MTLLHKIAQSGVSFVDSKSEKRNIEMTNRISMIASAASILLLLSRFFFAYVNVFIVITLAGGAILLLLPILLNRFSFVYSSRLLLCWLPVLHQLFATIKALEEIAPAETSPFLGLRFFLIAFCCIPFLIFSLTKNKFLIIAGLLGPGLSIILYDPILNLFHVGYNQLGLHEKSYSFNSFRALLSGAIIGTSAYFLKRIVEEKENINERLIKELDEKNKIIKAQAAEEFYELNKQLTVNVQNLKEREFILNESQRIAKIGSWEYRIKNKSRVWSDELYNIFGLDKHFNIDISTLPEYLWGKQSEIIKNATKDLLQKGVPYDLTLNTKTPLGYIKWIRICAFPISVNNQIIGEVGICHDITLYKESEEKIKLNDAKYRSLFNQATDAIVIADLKGNLTDFNPSLIQLLGFDQRELLQRNFADLIDQEELKLKPIQFSKLAEGEHISTERRIIRKDGSFLEIEANIKKFEEHSLMGFIRDVTQRKKIELELREAESKFRNLVEQSLVGVYIMLHGKFAYVNPQFAEIFGYTQGELTNSHSVDVIVHPDDRAMVAKNVMSRLKGEVDSVRYELRGICKSGEMIWIEAFGSKTQFMGEPAVIGTLIDITERKDFEKQHALLASLVSSSEDAIISESLDSIITSWNHGAAKLFGHSAEEVIGKPIMQLIPVEFIHEEEYIMNRIHDGLPVEHFETQRKTKSGNTIHISLVVSPLKDNQGHIIGASRIARDITEQKRTNEEKDHARYLLNERIKELRTLYNVSQILQTEKNSIEQALQQISDILPSGWQYPEITSACITFDNRKFKSQNFTQGVDKQIAEFHAPHGLVGAVELSYKDKMPPSVEGPFLKEERDLINMISDMLRVYLTRKQEAEALKNSEANLNATINNTTFFVWSINQQFKIQNINKPFKHYIKNQFGIDIQEGQSIAELHNQGVMIEEFKPRWHDYYSRALKGSTFELYEEYDGRTFKYSLNPIIENDLVTGVSVFSEETTELKKKEKQLLEAKQQISDLKLMALRAAMNPHFIFNTLNSIQYYIMNNDQINAVSYLSTFSKLIRGILNNSVSSKVKLNDEIEMLGHYISLEQMRFENKFDFELEVQPDLDVENIEIPSMLIQPYVENAILHGLYNKLDKGILKICIQETEEGILFEIEDDGIGREEAKRLHSGNQFRHKSFGTALTEERLKLINSNRNVSFEIIDLKNEGKPTGTKVKIWVAA